MDVYSYLNSKDVADYCRSIQYEFNSVEAAFFVHEANHITLQKRHGAYQEIVDSMPDMPYCVNGREYASFHQILIEHMRLEKRLLAAFYAETDEAVYTYGYYVNLSSGGETFYEVDAAYKTLAELLSVIKPESCDDTHGRYLIYDVTKVWLGSEKRIHAEIASDGRPLRCASDNIFDGDDNRWCRRLFENMQVEIPTPFSKGDILTGSAPALLFAHGGCWREPFVLGELYREKENRESVLLSPKVFFGYWVDEDGRLSGGNMKSWHNSEYYRGELSDDQRILAVVSNHIKSNMDYAKLLNSYEAIRLEKYRQEACIHANFCTDEGLV